MKLNDFRSMTLDAKVEYLFSVCSQAAVELPIAKREITYLRNRVDDLENVKLDSMAKPRKEKRRASKAI